MRRHLVLSLVLILSLLLLSSSLPLKILKLPKALAKQYAFVPMGEARLGDSTLSVMAFYISKTEISNAQYREFLADLKVKGRLDDLAVAQIDSAGWDIPYSYCEPFRVHYHSHPAFDNYPVVNISHAGAELYCAWMEEGLNANYPDISFRVRLPHRAEWIRAARLDHHIQAYSWRGPFLRDSKGCYLCNFRAIGEENIHWDVRKNNFELITGAHTVMLGSVFTTAMVSSYEPNELGIYNMNGNVAEMIREDSVAVGGSWNDTGFDVRNESVKTYDAPNPMTGFRPVISAYGKEN